MTPEIQNNTPSVIQFISATVSALPEAQRQFIAAEAKARLDTTLAHRTFGDSDLVFASLNRPSEQKLLAADQQCAQLLADPLNRAAGRAAVDSLRQLTPEETLSCVTSAISKFRQQEDGSGTLARDTGLKIFEFLTTVYESIPYPDANNFRTRNNQSQTWQSASYPLKHQLAVLRAEHALELPPDLCRKLRASLREALCGPKLQRTDPNTGDITIIDSMHQINDRPWVDRLCTKIRAHINEHTNRETPTPLWLVEDKQWLQELHSRCLLDRLSNTLYPDLVLLGPSEYACLIMAIDPTFGKASENDVHRSALAKLPIKDLMPLCNWALRAYHFRAYEEQRDGTFIDSNYPFNLVLEVCYAKLQGIVEGFLREGPDAVRGHYQRNGLTDLYKLRRLTADYVIQDMQYGRHTKVIQRYSDDIGVMTCKRLCRLWDSVSATT